MLFLLVNRARSTSSTIERSNQASLHQMFHVAIDIAPKSCWISCRWNIHRSIEAINLENNQPSPNRKPSFAVPRRDWFCFFNQERKVSQKHSKSVLKRISILSFHKKVKSQQSSENTSLRSPVHSG